MGTPKTLKQAIQNGLAQGQNPSVVSVHVRDYLAQHFTAAALYAQNKEEEDRIIALFRRLTRAQEEKS